MDVGGTLEFAAVPTSLVLVGHVSKLECDSSPSEVAQVDCTCENVRTWHLLIWTC